jgi:hypothetical protein
VSYVANPVDPKARRFWAICLAGQVTYTQVNDKGVAMTETAGGVRDPRDCDFGVPWQVALWHAIAYSRSMSEAAKIVALGTSDYRKRTGRATLLRTGGCNFLVADRMKTCVLETSAHMYAVRRPGDAAETGRYIVVTNHNHCAHSYSEKNSVTDSSMDFGGVPGSDSRFWTIMWLIRNNYGRIDKKAVQHFVASHFVIDKEGTRTDFQWNRRYGWIPMHLSQEYSTTPCAHTGGFPEKNLGGTQESKVISIREKEAEISYVQGRPCESNGKWQLQTLELS